MKKTTPKKRRKNDATQRPVRTSREQALRTGRIAPIDGASRTRADIERELAAIPADFIRTRVTPILLVREAEEMLRFRDDASTFAARGIDVKPGHYDLIAALGDMLREAAGLRDVAAAAHGGFDEMEDAHAEQVRRAARRLRLLAEMSALSPELASMGDADGNLRVMDAGSAIVARVKPHLALFKPATEARVIVDELERTVRAMADVRAAQAGEAGATVVGSERVQRIKRLLLDTLRYVGAAGQFAFEDDATRAAAYRLQHVSQSAHASRARKQAATEPPA